MKTRVLNQALILRVERGGTRPLDGFSAACASQSASKLAGPRFARLRIAALLWLRKVGLAAWLALAVLVVGCGYAAQQKAYEKAERAEQQLTAENAAAIIAEYKQVIALQPDSAWAQKARVRLTAVDTKVKAEELHKSVFQEHGVD